MSVVSSIRKSLIIFSESKLMLLFSHWDSSSTTSTQNIWEPGVLLLFKMAICCNCLPAFTTNPIGSLNHNLDDLDANQKRNHSQQWNREREKIDELDFSASNFYAAEQNYLQLILIDSEMKILQINPLPNPEAVKTSTGLGLFNSLEAA